MSPLGPWPAWPLRGPDGDRDPSSPEFDAAAVLETDRPLLRAAFDCSRAAFEELCSVLRVEQPLHGGEDAFFALAAAFEDVPADARAAVWSDPRAYWWTRVAHDLVRTGTTGTPLSPFATDVCTALGVEEPLEALAQHLRGFGMFGLGIAVVTGGDCTLVEPLTVEPPFAVPGTALVLEGSGPLELRSVRAGRVDVAGTTRTSPAARHDGFVLPLEPAAFAVPAFTQAEPAVRAGRRYQEEHADLVSDALGAIARFSPGMDAQLRELFRVGGLKPLDQGGFDDFSEPTLPGSLVVSVVDRPVALGDHLIHELRHHRLSMVEESGPLLEPGGGTAFYSPWRKIRRGLYGIYHGVYVFTAVYWYWRSVWEADGLAPIDRALATDRVLRIPRQLELAAAVVGRNARFTVLGAALFEQLERDVASISADAAALGIADDAPAIDVAPDGTYGTATSEVDGRSLTVHEALVEHLEQHDVEHQASGVLTRGSTTS